MPNFGRIFGVIWAGLGIGFLVFLFLVVPLISLYMAATS